MMVSMIAAISANDVIGRDGDMPWHISKDLQYFKRMTLGKTCIMGRTTFESILRALGKPFPGRKTIILSRSGYDYDHPDVYHAATPEDALEIAGNLGGEEVMITGGGQIYKLFLDQAERLYLTEIEAEIEGDAFFPRLDMAQWHRVEQEQHDAGETHPAFSFSIYHKNILT